jgi:hypothetical protein
MLNFNINNISPQEEIIIEIPEEEPPQTNIIFKDLEIGPPGPPIIIEYKCIICLDSNEEKEYTFLPCCHKFHVVCIETWIIKRALCPLCKTPVNIETPDQLQKYYNDQRILEDRRAQTSIITVNDYYNYNNQQQIDNDIDISEDRMDISENRRDISDNRRDMFNMNSELTPLISTRQELLPEPSPINFNTLRNDLLQRMISRNLIEFTNRRDIFYDTEAENTDDLTENDTEPENENENNTEPENENNENENINNTEPENENNENNENNTEENENENINMSIFSNIPY